MPRGTVGKGLLLLVDPHIAFTSCSAIELRTLKRGPGEDALLQLPAAAKDFK